MAVFSGCEAIVLLCKMQQQPFQIIIARQKAERKPVQMYSIVWQSVSPCLGS